VVYQVYNKDGSWNSKAVGDQSDSKSNLLKLDTKAPRKAKEEDGDCRKCEVY